MIKQNNIRQNNIEKWDVFETEFQCRVNGNPFTKTNFGATFQINSSSFEVDGFYDGQGIYKVRFMPDALGKWSFVTKSNCAELDGNTGEFICVKPSGSNKGPVKVSEKYHFSYADKTPFFHMGTTIYAWWYRPPEVRDQTLESITRYGFNKVRMLFFPKWYSGENSNSNVEITYTPPYQPFAKKKNENLDFSFFNVKYFQDFEKRIKDLAEIGVEAEIILFHPYDDPKHEIAKNMNHDDDIRYLKYLISRISSYKNVWWSLANEYDLFSESIISRPAGLRKKDWDAIGQFVSDNDPYNHLLTIHNWPFGTADSNYGSIYPDKNWMTHVSFQHPNTFSLILDLKKKYNKPVINDEYQYEGNLQSSWGNCSARQEFLRHWLTVMAGGYGTHGETYIKNGNNKDIFWAYGGTLTGQSPPRLAFLKEIIQDYPYHEMEPDLIKGDGLNCFCIKKDCDFYLYFITDEFKDRANIFIGPADGGQIPYNAKIYDAWNLKLIRETTVHSGYRDLKLPDWAVVKLARCQPGKINT